MGFTLHTHTHTKLIPFTAIRKNTAFPAPYFMKLRGVEWNYIGYL
jgi:hypothetical protein